MSWGTHNIKLCAVSEKIWSWMKFFYEHNLRPVQALNCLITVNKIIIIIIIIKIKQYCMVQDIWKAGSHSACQTVACFLCGIPKLITVLTKARHWALSVSRIQFAPSIRISLRSTLKLFFHLPLDLSRGVLPSDLQNRTLFQAHSCYMSRPPHPPWFNDPNNIRWKEYKAPF
jgi:hypothetical protein